MARSLADSERAAYEAHIASLNDQIAWLRASVETLTGLGTPRAVQETLPAMESKPWASEEEEEIQEMVDAGLMDAADAIAALEAAGALSSTVEFP